MLWDFRGCLKSLFQSDDSCIWFPNLTFLDFVSQNLISCRDFKLRCPNCPPFLNLLFPQKRQFSNSTWKLCSELGILGRDSGAHNVKSWWLFVQEVKGSDNLLCAFLMFAWIRIRSAYLRCSMHECYCKHCWLLALLECGLLWSWYSFFDWHTVIARSVIHDNWGVLVFESGIAHF